MKTLVAAAAALLALAAVASAAEMATKEMVASFRQQLLSDIDAYDTLELNSEIAREAHLALWGINSGRQQIDFGDLISFNIRRCNGDELLWTSRKYLQGGLDHVLALSLVGIVDKVNLNIEIKNIRSKAERAKTLKELRELRAAFNTNRMLLEDARGKDGRYH